MRKIAIITKNDINNYGNRLQNYALQRFLQEISKENYIITIKNISQLNNDKDKRIKNYLKRIKNIYAKKVIKKSDFRKKMFINFDKNINFSKKVYDKYHKIEEKSFDYFIVGSDQVWNYNFDMPSMYFLSFSNKDKNISYAASFGIECIPQNLKKIYRNGLNNFKSISVREEAGKKIVEELTGREDVQVLVDPTMLLTAKEWDKVAKKPEQLKTDKYILNYFLGELSEERKEEINRAAKENNCEVINILDKNSPFYQTGPSEFLYLEKNAFLICTDSFHSSVFAVLYNRPFIVFDREDSLVSMNSRIETLINKFNLKNRKFTGKITEKNLNHDYKEAYEILEKERKKSDDFLRKALEINE